MVFGFGRSSSAQSAPGAVSQKDALKSQIKEELAYQQASELIDSISRNCYDHCITVPGGSFSKSDQACISKCMERYMEAWNIVSKTYISRIQQEARTSGAPQTIAVPK